MLKLEVVIFGIELNLVIMQPLQELNNLRLNSLELVLEMLLHAIIEVWLLMSLLVVDMIGVDMDM